MSNAIRPTTTDTTLTPTTHDLSKAPSTKPQQPQQLMRQQPHTQQVFRQSNPTPPTTTDATLPPTLDRSEINVHDLASAIAAAVTAAVLKLLNSHSTSSVPLHINTPPPIPDPVVTSTTLDPLSHSADIKITHPLLFQSLLSSLLLLMDASKPLKPTFAFVLRLLFSPARFNLTISPAPDSSSTAPHIILTCYTQQHAPAFHSTTSSPIANPTSTRDIPFWTSNFPSGQPPDEPPPSWSHAYGIVIIFLLSLMISSRTQPPPPATLTSAASPSTHSTSACTPLFHPHQACHL